MALFDVKVDLRPVTTRQQVPMFLLELNLHFKRKKYMRDLQGHELLVQSETEYCPPIALPSFQVHPHSPAECESEVDFVLSAFNFNYDLRGSLRQKIASYLVNEAALLGDSFHVVGDIEFVIQEFLDMQEVASVIASIESGFESIEEGVESIGGGGGASISALEELKNGRFYATESNGDDCAICLEEFFSSGGGPGGTVELLMKMPCGHIFHDKCIFRWLESRKSCPMCRHEVEN